jgi:hypothetical protein
VVAPLSIQPALQAFATANIERGLIRRVPRQFLVEALGHVSSALSKIGHPMMIYEIRKMKKDPTLVARVTSMPV